MNDLMKPMDGSGRIPRPVLDPVVIQEPVKFGESLPGYLIRMAETNGYAKASWLTHAIGLDTTKISEIGLSNRLPELSQLLGADHKQLESIACIHTGAGNETELIFPPGHVLPRYCVDIRQYRACPKCLEEKGYIESLWSLKSVVACPEHGLPLRSDCSQCGKKLSKTRGSVMPCACFAMDLDQPCSKPVLELMRLIANRAAGYERYQLKTTFPPDIAEHSLADLLKVISFLSLSFLPGRKIRLRMTRDISYGEYTRGLEKAAQTLINWPNGLHEFWSQFFDRDNSRSDELCLRDKYDQSYAYLIDPKHKSAFGFIAKELARYLSYEEPDCILTNRGDVVLHEGQRYISRYQARKELRVSKWEVERAIRHKELKTRSFTTSYGAAQWVLASSLKDYQEEREYLLSYEEALEYFGCLAASMKSILKAGLIKPVHGRGIDQSFRRYFDPKSFDDLLSRLNAGMPTHFAYPEMATLSYREAARLSGRRLSLVRLIRLRLKGVLNAAPSDSSIHGFEGLHLYQTEIEHLLDLYGRELTFNGDEPNSYRPEYCQEEVGRNYGGLND